MNKNNLLVGLLILLIGASIYFLSLALSSYLAPPSNPSFEFAEAPEEAPALLREPPAPPTPEEKAARRDLRSANIETGSIGDKMLNFLLSEKEDFSREMYEIKYHQFDEQQLPENDLQQELILLSRIMSAYNSLEIEVVSHTHDAGTWDEQQATTASRAENIKQFLVDQGIASKRISASGYGATYPIADNTSDRGRAMNERIEILIRAL
ncbi:MAG: OmpA family protein [Bacteroidota bacterium]